MPKRGCGVLFYDKNGAQVLLFRRDDKSTIPFPNHLDILGGTVEEGETPEEAIVREMAEELEVKSSGKPFQLENFESFDQYVDEDDVEQNIFCVPISFNIDEVVLKEGQCLVWITEKDLDSTTLAFGFNRIVKEFFSGLQMVYMI
jgi:8-oxo-dGTP diphosphatase